MNQPRYAAFLSYSHADRAKARWLHSRLESYRFPEGVLTNEGAVPESISPVFRDREELQAGSLTKAIQEALSKSEILIVLCSPKAAQSKWVNREIGFFREAHGGERIFAIVCDGKAGASAGSAEAAFPKALYGSAESEESLDVLAPDLRKSGEGKQLALLKLIAGLRKVALDDLVQRDQGRAIRRLRWLVGGCVALLVVFALLGFGIFLQREEAIRQRDMARTVRDEAQALNTFFIGDLRGKLRAVGRLDLLEDATERVLAYHETLPAELADDAEVQRAVSMALDYRGQMAMQKGDAEAAVESLKESRTRWESLLERPDSKGDAVQGYAINAAMLAEAFRAAGNLTGERRILDEGIAALGGLRPTLLGDAELLARTKSRLHSLRGDVLSRLGEMDGARVDLVAGVSLAREATESQPVEEANWNQAADALQRWANYHLQVRDFETGLEQAEAAVAAAEAVVEFDPENSDAWSRLADVEGTLYMMHQGRGEWEVAEHVARSQISWRNRVFDRDRSNPTSEAKLAMAKDNLAFALAAQSSEKWDESFQLFGEAIAHFAGLLQRHPTRNDWRRSMALVAKRRGDLTFQAEAWELALKDYRTCERLRAGLAESAPGSARFAVELANIRVAIGEVLGEMGGAAEAVAVLQQAKDTLQSAGISDDHPAANELRTGIEKAIEYYGEGLPP